MSAWDTFIGFLCLAIFLVAAASLLTGCGAGANWLTKPVQKEEKVYIPAHVTNVVETFTPPPQITVTTQMVQGIPVVVRDTLPLPPVTITNAVVVPERIITNLVTSGYEANPQLLQGLSVAQQVNAALNPTPTAPLVNMGLGFLTALATGFAAWKSRQLQNTRHDLEPKTEALATLIKAIELFPGGERAALKEHIQTHASLDQTQAALDAEVQSRTN